jgi:formylglycine-generating enzyme required for sulfatase activity
MEESVRLDDFFIDQYEVTNREYMEFVTAGGYADQQFWKHPFVQFDHDIGTDHPRGETPRELSWEDGIALLIDRTGSPGPRGWTDQQYPAGKDDHPVTGVTWYEAAAYAEFRGKRLPTVFQWEKASRDETTTLTWWLTMPWGVIDRYDDISDRANLAAQGTMPVGSFEFGLSPYGCHDMAGNVWEWCLNARPAGFTTAGCSWREGANLFSSWGQFPGFYTSETLGFRCVLNKSGAADDQGALPLPDKDDVPVFEPVSKQEFELLRAH